MSENVVTLPGKRPGWMSTLSEYVGPAECRAFLFAAVRDDGQVVWVAQTAVEDVDTYATAGAAQCGLDALLSDITIEEAG